MLPRRIILLLAGLFGTLFLYFAAQISIPIFLDPDQLDAGNGPRWLPECQILKWTGRECPTCGMTRAFARISRGDWKRATERHWLAPQLYFLFILFATGSLIASLRMLKSALQNPPQTGS